MDWGPKKQFDAPLSYGRAVAGCESVRAIAAVFR
jgi:hypothetical protein